MKASIFDEMTKALATSTSRRHALKTIAATTIGALLGLGGVGTAFAKCHPDGHACDDNSSCCSKVCRNGICACAAPLCNGSCPSPCSSLGDPCGSCGSGNCRRDNSGTLYCGNGLVIDGGCTTDCDCAAGYFCYIGGLCMALC